MKVDVNMSPEDKFYVSSWYATEPEWLVSTLCQQLEAATAIWPELKEYKIEKRRSHKNTSQASRGAKGGHARATALSPERRTEIASEAAKARWGTDTGSTA